MKTVMVLGGAGFIGRHAVAALLAANYRVIVGSRHPNRIQNRLKHHADQCASREIRLENLTSLDAWPPHLAGVDALINCVGILRERGQETYDDIHLHAPTALAQACKKQGIRMVHVSALGLNHPHQSGFLRSKLAGEKSIQATGADYCLVRPSLLDGEGGYGASWIRRLSRLPVHLIPTRATGKIAALDVAELGEALAKLVDFAIAPDARPTAREFDLGGLVHTDIGGLMQSLRLAMTGAPAYQLGVPGQIARLSCHICDLLHFSPFSFGHWELLQKDNLPHLNRLPELLGRTPRTLGSLSA